MAGGVPESGRQDERPQADLVEFGRRAVEGADLEELLSEAAAEVASSLGVKFVKILEYMPEERHLKVRAGFGWDQGVIGHATVGADLESPAGFALQTGEPVISNRLDEEERFRIPPLLSDHEVKSAVNVIIKNGANVFGVLEADSRIPMTFSAAEVRFLQGYANILAFVIEQKRLVEQNLQFARMQEMFFNELQHRMKNNNQRLLSLINLQLSDATNIEARENLEKIATRILALSRVNEQLTAGMSPQKVDLGQYLLAVVASLFDFRRDVAADIRLETDVAMVEIGTEHAQAIGLMVNEFLTNSFKHAFKGGGTFKIDLQREADRATLRLRDDGPGFGANIKIGLGLKLIEALARQLDAEVRWPPGEGTTLEIVLPLNRTTG